MGMNRYHQWLCSSEMWAKDVRDKQIPWALDGTELGEDVLEIGPGYGATTSALVDLVPRLTSVEIDEGMAGRLERLHGARVRVLHGDGTALPLPDKDFSAVVCFTMLHHVPTAALQDRLFAEAFRVLRPGGVFTGSDGVYSLGFRLIHIGDTFNPVDPDTLPARLRAAGFDRVEMTVRPKEKMRFRAYRD
ncbi:class I SAM-dependent methyltransferase [Allokutzneria albata]|uniref:Methyltransferase domain-containing protein n=1 Tax=Allokutzneria albata TaxID=211114 RepID=A0A1G9WKY0_ALLAB|nr:class I SAM-dependent methyltransferase [Allokutzneria albata]SDM85198.1 Methyltransferase domain-containing protein [Allokutzneria albata]